MTPLQRNGMYAFKAPVPPSFLLRIDVGGNVTVRRFVYSECYVSRRGIYEWDDPVWVLRVT